MFITGFFKRSPRPPLTWPRSSSLGGTSRGRYQIALPWYYKTLLMSRVSQVLRAFGRGPQTMKGWEHWLIMLQAI